MAHCLVTRCLTLTIMCDSLYAQQRVIDLAILLADLQSMGIVLARRHLRAFAAARAGISSLVLVGSTAIALALVSRLAPIIWSVVHTHAIRSCRRSKGVRAPSRRRSGQVDAPAVIAAGKEKHEVQRVEGAAALVDLVQLAVASVTHDDAALEVRCLPRTRRRKAQQLSQEGLSLELGRGRRFDAAPEKLLHLRGLTPSQR